MPKIIYMSNSVDFEDDLYKASSNVIVTWSNKYETGIDLIDNQHKELVILTNALYNACLDGKEQTDNVFKKAMGKMVDYVKYHFSMELVMLKNIKYPGYNEHKKQHDSLIENILAAAKEYGTGKQFVPNNFVRTLRDWVFGHIAVYDKAYSIYICDQKRKGLLFDEQINTDSPGLAVNS